MNVRFIIYYTLRFFSRLIFGRSFLIRNKLAVNLYLFLVSIVHFFSIAHRKQQKWEKENPNAPWLVPESVLFLEKWLQKNMKGFEFGSGRSTKWFTNKVSFYYSIEGNLEWYNKTIDANKKNIQAGRCEIVYRDIGDQLEIDLNKKNTYANSLSKFQNNYFDFGLVDGHFRYECIQKSLDKIKKGGILIIDNTDAIDEIEFLFNKYKYKTFSNGISVTSIFYL
tara:strand:+ start:118 stop:786 length:669 start_codon:yes stop_codon:yes gene_type:complete